MTTSISAAEWDTFLAQHPQAHILQTSAWASLKTEFGWSAARVGIRQHGQLVAGAQILFRSLPFELGTIAYIPQGPLGDWTNHTLTDFVWESLDTVCRSARAIFLKVEPPPADHFVFPPGKFVPARPIQPRRTLVVDLQADEDTLLEQMKQKTRYNIRLAAKKGVVVERSDDIDTFNWLVQVTGERDRFGVHSSAYYRKAYDLFHPLGQAHLFVASFEGKPLAALMLFTLGKRAWYFYGGSSNEERNRMPTYLLQWEAMRWAKAAGCAEYDLWGVPDEDEDALEAQFESRSDGLWGVYRFKRGFGGQLMRAPATHDRIYSTIMYRIYLAYINRRQAGVAD